MFAEDRSAEQPLSVWLQGDENPWRAGVRRFRRGWPRIKAGARLVLRGIEDLLAGLPAVVVVAGALLLVWLGRRVALVRSGLLWTLAAHRAFRAAQDAFAKAVARAWRPIALGSAAFAFVLVATPALGLLIEGVAWLLKELMTSGPIIDDQFEPPPPPTLPELDLDSILAALAIFFERAVYAVVILALAGATIMAALIVVAYAAFLLHVLVRAMAWTLVAAGRGLWRAFDWSVAQAERATVVSARAGWRTLAWIAGVFVSAIGGVARGLGIFGAWSVRWTARATAALLRLLWRAVGFIVGLAASAIMGAARTLWSIGAWTLMLPVRAVAAAGRLAARTLRAVVRAAGALLRLCAQAAAAAGRALAALAGALARLGVLLFRSLATILAGGARLVWAHVFRLFALTGTVAAITFIAWAAWSMKQGRSVPEALLALAPPVIFAAGALLALLSALAILAAIALAIRHAPPRLVRQVGLAALLLLALAPLPVLGHVLWVSPLGAAARARALEVLAWAQEMAPLVGLGLAALAAGWLALVGLVWLVRRIPRAAWAAAGNAILGLSAAAGAAYGVAWLWSTLPADALDAWLRRAGEAAAALAPAVAIAVAAVGALWLLARAPAQLRRATALAALAFVGVILLGLGGREVWRRAEPPVVETWKEAREAWEKWQKRADGKHTQPEGEEDQDESKAAAAPEPGRGRTARIEPPATPTWLATWLVTLQAAWGKLISFLLPPFGAAQPDSEPSTWVDQAAPPAPEPPPLTQDRMPDRTPFSEDVTPAPDPREPAPPAGPLTANRIFPREGDLHWRFGRADLVGDGLTAFRRIEDAAAGLDVCGAEALVAIGMASSEGAPAFNEGLAQCRAEVLAALAREQALACTEPGAPRIFTLSLGPAISAQDAPRDRRALILRLEDADGLDQDRAGELDPLVERHSGRWELLDFGGGLGEGDAGVTACSLLGAQ